jgi:hypothetical protein
LGGSKGDILKVIDGPNEWENGQNDFEEWDELQDEPCPAEVESEGWREARGARKVSFAVLNVSKDEDRSLRLRVELELCNHSK